MALLGTSKGTVVTVDELTPIHNPVFQFQTPANAVFLRCSSAIVTEKRPPGVIENVP